MALISAMAQAALADGVKVTYHPGMSMTDHQIEINIPPSFNKDDEMLAAVFAKMKAIEATGRLDYLVPDAPYTTFEVTYQGQTITAQNATTVPKVSGYEAFQKAWDEAYALVW